MEHYWIDNDEGTPKYSVKILVSTRLNPPQIPQKTLPGTGKEYEENNVIMRFSYCCLSYTISWVTKEETACAAEYWVLVLKRGDSLEDLSIDGIRVHMLKLISGKQEKLKCWSVILVQSRCIKWDELGNRHLFKIILHQRVNFSHI